LAPLVTARQAQGLTAAVIPVAEIYDAFGAGEHSPDSINQFVTYAATHWQEPHPRYLLLVGEATTDYRRYDTADGRTPPTNHVPSPLVSVAFSGETVSDSRLADVDGDGQPDLAVAFIPAAGLGLAFGGVIKAHLFSPVPVALAFIIGGVVILLVERRPRAARIDSTRAMDWRDALKVGIAQCFALIPGTSRSGATIIGGMLFGMSRPAATEFSFFLAVPTLIAAGGYDLWKHRALFSADDLQMVAVGAAVSFVSALVVIRWLVRYVATHDFRPFAWYRIAFGVIVLATAYSGAVSWSAS
jgi:undecaprenyl-diphosphatase UppP